MNPEFPPLPLHQPQAFNRRPGKGRRVPIPPEVVARRELIARQLVDNLTPLSEQLKKLTDEERKAVFYKLEHENPVPLSGTGLKPIVDPSKNITIAVPREGDLERLKQKLEQFGTGELKDDQPPNAQLGANLISVQQGIPEDRLSEVFLEQVNELIAAPWTTFEIEIISLQRGRAQQRKEIQSILQELTDYFRNTTNGRVLEYEEIKGTCRAIIGCRGGLVRDLIYGKDWQVKISWFDVRPEFKFLTSILDEFHIENIDITPPPNDAPVVCIVDSGITPGNPFLEPVTRQDLMRCFLDADRFDEFDHHGHGSGVGSLAAYYALNLATGAENEGRVWLASARILDETNSCDERLFSKMIAEVVDTFAPLGIKIFNLAVNITNQKWNQEAKRTIPRKSWTARALDRLAKDYDVVFIISAGNVTCNEIDDFHQNGSKYPDYLCHEDSSILDPGQAALALTIGSVAPGSLVANVRNNIEMPMADANHPSPFTRSGPGIRRETKPELVEYGGNYLADHFGHVYPNAGTNIVVATHQLTPAITTGCGTSLAAPRATHKLALIQHDLEALINPVTAPLLRAAIVGSASYDFLGDEFEDFANEISKLGQKHWLNILGYGLPDDVIATYCDDYSVLMFYVGEIESNKVVFFDIPVPEALADGRFGQKRLSITVAYAPEVQRWGLESYFGTQLKWRVFRGDVNREEVITAMSDETDNDEGPADIALPNEVPNPRFGINLRSRGSVQHDVFIWSRHERGWSANNYTLAVSSMRKWGSANTTVPIAVIARLDDTTQSVPIYTEVQNIIAELRVVV